MYMYNTNMSEFDQFLIYNKGKSDATQLQYKSQYNKLHSLVDPREIADVSQKKILEIIYANYTNPNQISSLINIALLVRRMGNMPTNELIKTRNNNKTVIEEHVKEMNSQHTLPSLN